MVAQKARDGNSPPPLTLPASLVSDARALTLADPDDFFPAAMSEFVSHALRHPENAPYAQAWLHALAMDTLCSHLVLPIPSPPQDGQPALIFGVQPPQVYVTTEETAAAAAATADPVPTAPAAAFDDAAKAAESAEAEEAARQAEWKALQKSEGAATVATEDPAGATPLPGPGTAQTRQEDAPGEAAPEPEAAWHALQQEAAQEIIRAAMQEPKTLSKDDVVGRIVAQTGLDARAAAIAYNAAVHRAQMELERDEKAAIFRARLNSPSRAPKPAVIEGQEKPEGVASPGVDTEAEFVPEHYETPLTDAQLAARLKAPDPYFGLSGNSEARRQVRGARVKQGIADRKNGTADSYANGAG